MDISKTKIRNVKWEFSFQLSGLAPIQSKWGAINPVKVVFTQYEDRARITVHGSSRGAQVGAARSVSYYLGGYEGEREAPPAWLIELVRQAKVNMQEV